MKLKCIKTSIDNPNNRIINSDMKEYLLIGTLFWVYGIRFFQNITYVYIYNGNHLVEVPVEMFSVIDDKVSDKWKIKIWDNGEVTLWPKLFYENEFLENFAEFEQKERELFKELSAVIER